MSSEDRPVLPPETGVGAVHIAVTDGKSALRFYEDLVGLRLISDESGLLRLGVGGRELVVLHPGAVAPVAANTTGLYHLAIVVPDRKELARVIARLGNHRYPQSPTDHVLTKANYIWDADGNGIEIYCETPEDGTWFFTDGGDGFGAKDATGQPRSGRDPIDIDVLFSELSPEDDLDAPMPDATRMGHVHLHVADLDRSVEFYRDLIGFDLMGRSQRIGMAFVSAGGYHHRLGLNTWAGRGAPPKPEGAAGLVKFTVEVPDSLALDDMVDRLDKGTIQLKETRDGPAVIDPSANQVSLRVRES